RSSHVSHRQIHLYSSAAGRNAHALRNPGWQAQSGKFRLPRRSVCHRQDPGPRIPGRGKAEARLFPGGIVMSEMDPKRPDPSSGVPQLEDRRLRIPGIVPKNAQGRILAGIAVLMAVIIALSGKNQREHTAATLAPSPAVTDPNRARIQEY